MTAIAHISPHSRKSMISSDQAEQMAHWQALVSKIANQRDRQPSSELFDQSAPRTKPLSIKALPGSDLVAEDLVQDVMIKVWNKAHLYNPEAAAVSTWIFTLARNTRIDQIRKNKHIHSEIDVDNLFDVLEDDGLDPFQATQIKNTEQMVRQSIDKLPAEQAQVIAITSHDGKSQQEADTQIALQLDTVKSRIRIALGKLELS